jgi:hypothetical protein
MSHSQYVSSVPIVCFSERISVSQGVALKSIISAFRAWSVEFGSIQVHLLSHERELSSLEELAVIYSILQGGIFFPESGSVTEFLEQAFAAGVYSWYIDRFAAGHVTVRLVQPASV